MIYPQNGNLPPKKGAGIPNVIICQGCGTHLSPNSKFFVRCEKKI